MRNDQRLRWAVSRVANRDNESLSFNVYRARGRVCRINIIRYCPSRIRHCVNNLSRLSRRIRAPFQLMPYQKSIAWLHILCRMGLLPELIQFINMSVTEEMTSTKNPTLYFFGKCFVRIELILCTNLSKSVVVQNDRLRDKECAFKCCVLPISVLETRKHIVHSVARISHPKKTNWQKSQQKTIAVCLNSLNCNFQGRSFFTRLVHCDFVVRHVWTGNKTIVLVKDRFYSG